MTPRRRASDTNWLLKYWPIVLVVGSMLVAFVHLEDDNKHTSDRMDFHWGKEW